jgi:hypothetical protein
MKFLTVSYWCEWCVPSHFQKKEFLLHNFDSLFCGHSIKFGQKQFISYIFIEKQWKSLFCVIEAV